MRHAASLLLSFIALVYFVSLAVVLSAQQPTVEGVHHHPEAQKLTNPLQATQDNIAAGGKVFADHCAECHGDEGKGDGMMAEDMDPLPPNLTDHEWKHGDTDGEIFAVIRDGTKDGMKKFGRKLTPDQIWQLVTYIRSIGPAAQKSQ